MKTLNLEQSIKEIDRIYDFYKDSEVPEARRCYNQYVETIVASSFPSEVRPALNTYWNRLKTNI